MLKVLAPLAALFLSSAAYASDCPYISAETELGPRAELVFVGPDIQINFADGESVEYDTMSMGTGIPHRVAVSSAGDLLPIVFVDLTGKVKAGVPSEVLVFAGREYWPSCA